MVATSCTGEFGNLNPLELAVRLTPEEMNLGTVWAGQSESRTLRLDNIGGASTEIVSATIVSASGPAFGSVTFGAVALPPGDQIELEVRVTAMGAGTGLYLATVELQLRDLETFTVPISAQILQQPVCNDDNPCTVDRFVGSACVYEVLSDGTGCDDNNACTQNTVCASGQCLGQPITCSDNIDCTIDACDPNVGCVFEPNPSRCNDDDECTDDLCNVVTGCTNTPSPPGTICYYNGCEEIGICTLGECLIAATPDGLPCEDGDGCTVGDACLAGECISGEQSEVGAAPPVTMAEGFYSTDLCLGFFDCNLVAQSTVQEVLDVRQEFGGGALFTLWRGEYFDTLTGAPCVPPSQLPPLGGDPNNQPPPVPPADPEGDAAEAPPSVQECAAGVFYSRRASNPGALPVTIQLTTTRGPVAGLVYPALPFGLDQPIAGGGSGRLLIATSDAGGINPKLHLFGESGQEERRFDLVRGEGPWPLAQMRLARWQTRVLLVAQPRDRAQTLDCDDNCNAIAGCCVGSKLDIWLFDLALGNDPVLRSLPVAESQFTNCTETFLPGSTLPWTLEDFEVSISPLDGEHAISFRMNPAPCGDLVDPGESRFRIPYALKFPAELADGVTINMLSSTSALGFVGVQSMHEEIGSGRAAAIIEIDSCDPQGDFHPEPPPPDCDQFPEDPACGAPDQSCVERWAGWVSLEQTLSLEDKLLYIPPTLMAQALPLLVELEPTLLTRYGQSIEVITRDEDGNISRLTTSSLPGGFLWDQSQRLRGVEGWVGGVASLTTIEDCCPVEEPDCDCDGFSEVEVRRLVLQGFQCGVEAAPEVGCIDASQCGSGQTCSHAEGLCLPVDNGGGADAGPNGDALCGGRCVEVNTTCFDLFDPCVPSNEVPLCPVGSLAAQFQCEWVCVENDTCVVLPDGNEMDGGVADSGAGDAGAGDGGGAGDDGGAGDGGGAGDDGGTANNDGGGGGSTTDGGIAATSDAGTSDSGSILGDGGS